MNLRQPRGTSTPMMRRSRTLFTLRRMAQVGLAAYIAASCSGDDETTIIPPPPPPPEEPMGALIGVSFEGQVGVLLDELPAELRARAVEQLLDQRNFFWRERA